MRVFWRDRLYHALTLFTSSKNQVCSYLVGVGILCIRFRNLVAMGLGVLFLFLAFTNPSFGQTYCDCEVQYENRIEMYTYPTDSLKLFENIKRLKDYNTPSCLFESIDIKFHYYLSNKQNVKAKASLEYQEEALSTLTCNERYYNQLLVNKAKYYQLTNKLDKLSEYAFKALEESERLKNNKLELESLKAVIYLFMRLDRDKENWEYTKRARDIIIEMNESKSKASEYIWLAYEYENQYIETERKSLIDSSFMYANAAKNIAKKYSLNRELAQSYRANEAIAYHKGDLKNALKYIDSAIYYGKKTKGVFNLSPFYIAKAWDLIDLGKLREASKYVDTSLIIDNKTDLGFSANVWHEAKEIYGITGDTTKAYTSFKMYTKLKDSILSIERIKSANDIEAKYKVEIKDAKIKNLTFLLALAIATILIIFLVFNLFRLRKVREKNKAIKQQLELEEELTNVRHNIAKDFHDDLGNKLAKITALSDLMTVKEKSKIELKEALLKIKTDSDKLYRGTKDFMFALKSENDDLDAVITYLTDFASDFFNDLNIEFSLQSNINQPIKLPGYWNRQIILICKEVMTNAAKHAKCSEVELSIISKDKSLTVSIKDDGIGFDVSKPSKKGLLNMRQRAKSIGAELELKSDKKGTLIKLKCKLP